MKRAAFLFVCVASLATTAFGQSPATPVQSVTPARLEDAKTLAALVADFTRAFNAGDARAAAGFFTPDGQIIDEGGMTDGRDAIQARFATYFQTNPKAKLAIQVDAIRFVSPEVAIEDGRAALTPVEEGGRPESTRYTVIYVKQDGKWYQSSLREFETDDRAVPERLKDLEWLVGDWVNESQDAVVATSCRWSEDRHFLLRDFTIALQGKTALKGTQRIGWDPVAKQIRSWVFDSQGGFGEGYWSRSGDQWMIKSEGVSRDGKTASGTQVITRIHRDHLKWGSFDRTSGGDWSPDIDELNLVRKPPVPSGSPVRPR